MCSSYPAHFSSVYDRKPQLGIRLFKAVVISFTRPQTGQLLLVTRPSWAELTCWPSPSLYVEVTNVAHVKFTSRYNDPFLAPEEVIWHQDSENRWTCLSIVRLPHEVARRVQSRCCVNDVKFIYPSSRSDRRSKRLLGWFFEQARQAPHQRLSLVLAWTNIDRALLRLHKYNIIQIHRH